MSLLGERAVEGTEAAPAGDAREAEALGVGLAERLLVDGAAEILAGVREAAGPPVTGP